MNSPARSGQRLIALLQTSEALGQIGRDRVLSLDGCIWHLQHDPFQIIRLRALSAAPKEGCRGLHDANLLRDAIAIHWFSDTPSSLARRASAALIEAGSFERVGSLAHGSNASRRISTGLARRTPKRAAATRKCAALNVTKASVRPVIATSRTISSSGSPNCGRQLKCASIGSIRAAKASKAADHGPLSLPDWDGSSEVTADASAER